MTQWHTASTPILVTGAHRTGTTWVGKMLAAGGQAAYISEPLNVQHRPGVMGAPVKYWYTYICTSNEADFLPAFHETVNLRYHLGAEIRSLRSGKDILRMVRDWSTFSMGKLRRQRALLKDPFAVFSIPWFAERLGCQVVVTIRHPAGFASSLKRLDWPFDFSDLLAQSLLMRDWLEPIQGRIEEVKHGPEDIIAQSSLLWRTVYQTVMQIQKIVPQLRILRHEDLSINPQEGFRALYAGLGMEFTRRAQKAILQSSGSENPKELSKRSVHSIRLDSRANLDNWKYRLEVQEIKRVRELTEDIAALYYPDQDWG